MVRIALHEMKRGPKRAVWVARWHGVDGKFYGKTIGRVGDMSRREADAFVRTMQADMATGERPIDKPQGITLAAFETAHAEFARGEVSAGTLAQYGHVFKWARRVIGDDTKLTAISASHAARIRNAMTDAGLEAPTIQKTLAYMRAAFNRAIDHKYLAKGHNPFAGFAKVDEADRTKEAVIRTRDEQKRLKAAAPDSWWRSAIGLWFTGLRLEEALTLKWSDIDLSAGTVTIRKCKAGSFKANEQTYPILDWRPKTKRSSRTVPIASDTTAALRQLKAESDGSVYAFLTLERLRAIEAMQQAGRWHSNSDMVNNVLRDWKALQRAVLGPDAKLATIHDCRKTYATHAADIIPIQTLAAYIGDTPNVLMKFYTRPREEHADKLRAAFDDGPVLKLAG